MFWSILAAALAAAAAQIPCATICAAFRVQQRALGWGENTMALPDFSAINAL
jgi:hypothetical protein